MNCGKHITLLHLVTITLQDEMNNCKSMNGQRLANNVKYILPLNCTGCFLRVLENSNTVCIFCDSAAVDLDNITVCTYSKDGELSAECL